MRCGPNYPSNRHACIKPPPQGILPPPGIPLTPDNPPPPVIPLIPDNPLTPGIPPLRIIRSLRIILPPPGIPPPPSKKAAISPLNTCKHFKQLGAMALGGNEHIDASRQFAGVAG